MTGLPIDLVGAHLWLDEYGSVWIGRPGEKGSTIVADVPFSDGDDPGSEWPIVWLPPEGRRTVR